MKLTHADGTETTVRAGDALNGVALKSVTLDTNDLKDFFSCGHHLGRDIGWYLSEVVLTRLVP